MLYMVIECFKDGQAGRVYARFRERGRQAPDGLTYLDSWVDLPGGRCFQLMQTDTRDLLEAWMAHWSDLIDFEVVPVVTSAEAAQTTLDQARLVVRCECGFEVCGPAEQPVPAVQKHGREAHNMQATPEQVLAMARPA
jgi:predicted small metal-binding protein